MRLFGVDAIVRVTDYDVTILDYVHANLHRDNQRVIVEEFVTGGRGGRLAWKLLIVHDDGFIGWNEEPLAMIYRKRDYERIFDP